MAEKKGVGHAYNIDFLNVVFAACSVFLFLSVVWMVWDDFDRDWKNTQRRFSELQYQVTQAQYRQAASKVDKTKLAQFQAQLDAAKKNVVANQKKVDELEAKRGEIDIRLDRAQRLSVRKATYDHDRATSESTRATGEAAPPEGVKRWRHWKAAGRPRSQRIHKTLQAERAAVEELAQYRW
jgi:chromosome segregation ATPase